MQPSRLKSLMRDGKVAIGPFLKFTDPAVVEIAAHAGFDFVIIDSEHGPISMETAQNMVRAAEACGISPVIRVRENTPSLILRALDIGAQGVQIPQVSTKAAATAAVSASRYYPDGDRGVCRFTRAASYSAVSGPDHFATSNQETTVIVHIEGYEGGQVWVESEVGIGSCFGFSLLMTVTDATPA